MTNDQNAAQDADTDDLIRRLNEQDDECDGYSLYHEAAAAIGALRIRVNGQANLLAEARRIRCGPVAAPAPDADAVADLGDWVASFPHNAPLRVCIERGVALIEQQARELVEARVALNFWQGSSDGGIIMVDAAHKELESIKAERDEWKRKYGDANEWGLIHAAAWKDRAERAERDRDDWKRLAENWTACADAAQQPPEFYEKYNEGTMRAMQALLTRARCEADAARAAIRCISVRGPDGDGLVWIVCTMPNGDSGAVSVASDRIAAKAFTAWREAAQKAIGGGA